MDRRLFLQSLGVLTLTQVVSGCGSNPPATLRVKLLKKSLPAQIIKQFVQTFQPEAKLEVTPKNNFKDLFDLLEDLVKPQAQRGGFSLPFSQPQQRIVPDLVTLSDSWLRSAIEKKLVQPLDVESGSNWQKLPKEWQNLVKRSDRGFFDAAGRVWGAPYRFGSTVILYRRDKFKKLGWEPKDWEALWQPELNSLSFKVDKLFQLIEALNQKVSQGLAPEIEYYSDDTNTTQHQVLRHKYKNSQDRDKDLQKEDRDLISDRSILNINSHSHKHKDFSPEMQVQRLTAQLTAAYNRIAALEEQLLSRRVG